MKSIYFRAMGCQMSAFVDSTSSNSEEQLQQVPVWFEAWEQSLSRFRPESELSHVNQQSGNKVTVSKDFWSILEIASQLERKSHGLVTPLVLPALEMAGYSISFDQIFGDSPITAQFPESVTGIQDHLILDPVTQTIQLPFGCRLDFGGIAKGWAAHKTMRRLSAYGPALVNAGGDIAISNSRDQSQAWKIGVLDPFQPERDLGSFEINHCGVATSGKDFRQWKQDGILRHHIIDPRTGFPAETDLLSATIIAPDVIEAEMTAKIIMILGSQVGMDLLDSQPHLTAVLVLEDGKILKTKNIEKFKWRDS
jgi:thiamine biosynthesis lipoprotein